MTGQPLFHPPKGHPFSMKSAHSRPHPPQQPLHSTPQAPIPPVSAATLMLDPLFSLAAQLSRSHLLLTTRRRTHRCSTFQHCFRRSHDTLNTALPQKCNIIDITHTPQHRIKPHHTYSKTGVAGVTISGSAAIQDVRPLGPYREVQLPISHTDPCPQLPLLPQTFVYPIHQVGMLLTSFYRLDNIPAAPTNASNNPNNKKKSNNKKKIKLTIGQHKCAW